MFFLLDLTTCQPFSFGACIIQKKHVWQQTDARQGQTYSPGLHQWLVKTYRTGNLTIGFSPFQKKKSRGPLRETGPGEEVAPDEVWDVEPWTENTT